MKKDRKPNQKGRIVHGPVIRLTGRQTHHFIVCDLSLSTAMLDEAGRKLVYLSRERAQKAAADRGMTEFAVVGMGDERWKLFQTEEPNHVVVEG